MEKKAMGSPLLSVMIDFSRRLIRILSISSAKRSESELDSKKSNFFLNERSVFMKNECSNKPILLPKKCSSTKDFFSIKRNNFTHKSGGLIHLFFFVLPCFFVFFGSIGCTDRHYGSKENVIYGENGISIIEGKRKHPWSSEFSAVALITEKSKITINQKKVLIRPQSALTNKICEGEPLKDALAIGHCTGFLLDEDTLVTARHCLELIQGGCENLAFIFDAYSKTSPFRSSSFPRENVYSCRRAIFPSDPILDLALVEIDRKSDRKPVSLHSTENWENIGELTVLGYPLGGRQRIAKGGKFRSSTESIYRAELDVFEGNSGSPLFASDRTVRGILVEGERDFERTDQGCLRVKHCQSGECLGEGFIPSEKISAFFEELKIIRDLETSAGYQIFIEKKSEKILIPDDQSEFKEISFFVESTEILSQVNLMISLDHPRPSDLLIYLISPSGKIINLSRLSSRDQLKNDYKFSSVELQSPLVGFLGENPQGLWSVIVKDFQEKEAGFLTDVALELFSAKSKVTR